MKIALIGYGKMGKAIESIAIDKGHQIVLKIGRSNAHELTTDNIRLADVCIEFSTPETAFDLVMKCLQAGIPTISGTTAWLHHLAEAQQCCLNHQTAFLYASNFSIGVNIFFEVNRLLAKLMAHRPEYEVSIDETHHTQKKDAPSGTAVSLAEDILAQLDHKKQWVLNTDGQADDLRINAYRIDPAPGTHSIHYRSEIDDITITHTAHNRIGFASGAVQAAEFICGRQGLYTMKDVLNLG
ncbi:MAG: 4-hydroxy-tetrahydrodipicolinate reductase [Chitinophagaceae bacterium]|nr:4-hydroxy-tetrahydrodipicolinate reductase [Chitinophagaceae bacterium]